MDARACTIIALALTACAGVPGVTTPSATLARDTTAYAMASCFAALPDAYLQDQGRRWAGGVIQGGAGPMEAWIPIAEAVKAELKTAGVAQGKPDGPAAPSVALPVLTCGQIADAPRVRSSIRTARRVLIANYRAAR